MSWRGASVMNLGRLTVAWWWPLRAWGLSYHGMPCCRFWLELGPLEVGVSPGESNGERVDGD